MTAPTPSEGCGNHGCTLPIHTGPCYITRAESDARVAEARETAALECDRAANVVSSSSQADNFRMVAAAIRRGIPVDGKEGLGDLMDARVAEAEHRGVRKGLADVAEQVAEAVRGQHWPSNCCPQCGTVNLTLDDRIVEAVREEREAIATLVDEWGRSTMASKYIRRIVAAIRARGGKK